MNHHIEERKAKKRKVVYQERKLFTTPPSILLVGLYRNGRMAMCKKRNRVSIPANLRLRKDDKVAQRTWRHHTNFYQSQTKR